MVVGERKPFEEITRMLEGHKKVMVLGCGGCVTVCLTGGDEAVRVLSSQCEWPDNKAILRDNQKTSSDSVTLYEEVHASPEVEAEFSMVCGAVCSSRKIYNSPLSRLNTTFVGGSKEGYYVERRQTCVSAAYYTGGIADFKMLKSLRTVRAGVHKGKCEIDLEVECDGSLLLTASNLEPDGPHEETDLNDWRTTRDGDPQDGKEDLKMTAECKTESRLERYSDREVCRYR
jgi:ferredoxin